MFGQQRWSIPPREGGNNDFVHQLPVRFKYTNIKLTRPLDKNTENVAQWFASMSGPLAPLFSRMAGPRIAESFPAILQGLAKHVEGDGKTG